MVSELLGAVSRTGARVFFCDWIKKGAAFIKGFGQPVGFHLVDLKRKVDQALGQEDPEDRHHPCPDQQCGK